MMRQTNHNCAVSPWGTAVVLAALLSCPVRAADAPQALTTAEFEKLHQALQPPRDELWRSVPWKLTLVQAQEQAARHKRPIFMLVRSGHPLGCV